MNFKTIVVAVACVLLAFGVTKWYYGNELDDIRTELRKEKEKYSTMVVEYNDQLGEVYSLLGVKEDQLNEAVQLTEKQKDDLKRLQKELNSKINIINNLTVQIDSLSSEGQSEIVVTGPDSVTYHVKEHKNGVGLDLTLEHPSGHYNYVITHDPINMELYIAKRNDDKLTIGAIRFPDNPNIKVGSWDLIYDTDTRPWYQKIWDDIHWNAGVFAGSNAGVITTLGYKKVSAGPVFTEDGMSIGVMYTLK